MAEFWADWGLLAYLAAAAWAFFEGETFVLLAAAAGQATGLINPWFLMISVWIGSFLGDQLWFTLGQRYGVRALRKLPAAERKVAKALRFLERYGTLFVLTFRFVYGVRNVASAACGIAGMKHSRFAILNFIAAGLWAGSFVAAGWYAVAWLGEEYTSYALMGIGALVVCFLAYKVVRLWRRPSAPVQAPELPPVVRAQEFSRPPSEQGVTKGATLKRVAI
ncbi:DedA family protein [Roseomonas sp. KE0001]|uniref:DedA family protein n=1 Tax=Roseomonas sp. KE0001 TaxID=2479201 RepID=UPI0018DF7BEF|nr:DedA family protein [Roseomonas sp. KE0001]